MAAKGLEVERLGGSVRAEEEVGGVVGEVEGGVLREDEEDGVWQGVPLGGEVFCNRALNLRQVQAVGFDMDYTLAEYIPETFDTLAYDGAIAKLRAMGYPEAIEAFEYDPYAYQRGLVIDKRRGNLLKLDRHKYVKVAERGPSHVASSMCIT